MTVITDTPRYAFHIHSSSSISSAAKHQHSAADRLSAFSSTPTTFSHVKAAPLLRLPRVAFSTSRCSNTVDRPAAAVASRKLVSFSAPSSRRPSVDLLPLRAAVRHQRSVSISTSSLRVTAPAFTPRSQPSRSSFTSNAVAKPHSTSPASPHSAPLSLFASQPASSPSSPSSASNSVSISSFFTSTRTPSLASLLCQSSWSSPSSPAALDLAEEPLDESELSFDMSAFDESAVAAGKRMELPEPSLLPRVQQRVSVR